MRKRSLFRQLLALYYARISSSVFERRAQWPTHHLQGRHLRTLALQGASVSMQYEAGGLSIHTQEFEDHAAHMRSHAWEVGGGAGVVCDGYIRLSLSDIQKSWVAQKIQIVKECPALQVLRPAP